MSLAFASVFSDHMVLQQGLPISVSGTAAAGATVRVTFGAGDSSAIADQAGDWRATLPAAQASAEPKELVAESAGQAVRCKDVLVGEVWVCSGQSNMEWVLSETENTEAAIAGADFPNIRLLHVPKRIAMQPEKNLAGGTWVACRPDTARSFSAVAYYFGRELHQRLGVPIGLINASWGGTPAETWTSREGYLDEPKIRGILEGNEADPVGLAKRQAEYRHLIADLDKRTSDTSNEGIAKGWANPADPSGEWKDMMLPATWQGRGLDISGILWFRKTIDVPASWAGKDLQLAIASTDKSDVTYFNGTQVGSVTMKQRPDSWSLQRVYPVAGNLVKAGKNVIAVRVHSDRFDGGMRGPAYSMYVSCPSDPSTSEIRLAGVWRYAIEKNYGKIVMPPAPPGPDNPNTPMVLHNGMIHALLPLTIRGAIWYQGESNAERAEQYRDLFPAMIKNWRKAWGREELAFYFVQLANYMDRKTEPTDTKWARLREAQTMTLRLPNTGMAVAIDIGDAADIHPRNKRDVGIRLALNALHRTYGKKDVIPCGPQFREMKIDGPAVRLSFDFATGLQSRGGELAGFAVAGDDRVFHWASAKIDGETVIVKSDRVPNPKAVRYAWADNPACNLYNRDELPAVPFRTDDW